jgi:hypothetical protein
MAQVVKYNTSHHAGATPEARIASRLRNSGGEEADHIVQKGSSAHLLAFAMSMRNSMLLTPATGSNLRRG